MKLVDPPHDQQVGRRDRPREMVDAAPADIELLCLTGQRQCMVTVDHRFAFGNRPAFPRVAAKKRFASGSSPILACSTVIPTAGSLVGGPAPNTSAASARSCARHWLMRLGCTSYCCANAASVSTPFKAASATFVLNVGLWFCRGRLLILPPLCGQHGRCQIGNPLIPAVTISRAISVRSGQGSAHNLSAKFNFIPNSNVTTSVITMNSDKNAGGRYGVNQNKDFWHACAGVSSNFNNYVAF